MVLKTVRANSDRSRSNLKHKSLSGPWRVIFPLYLDIMRHIDAHDNEPRCRRAKERLQIGSYGKEFHHA